MDGELPTIEFEKVYKQIINMDIDLLSKIVKEIILDKDEVSLPGLGSFIAELVPSVFSDKGYTINPPYKRLYFRQKENPQDTSLIDFYASSNKIEKQIASDIVCDFLRELRKVLEVKKTIIFPGLGRLRATKENYFFFVADENLDIYPEGFGLEPISLKTHEETTSEVSNTMATLRAILSPEEDANEPAQVKVNADVTECVAVENSHSSETAENVTVEMTKSTTDGVTAETVAANTEEVTINSATSEEAGKATAGTVNSATNEVNGTEIAEAAGNATANGNEHINGTMSENATTDVTERGTDGVAEVVTGGAAIGAVANVTEKASENANESVTGGATEGATKNSVEIITDAANDVAAANVTEEASENTNKIETEVTTNGATAVAAANANESATDGVAEITTCAAHKVATANVTEEVSENTDTGATAKVKQNAGEDTNANVNDDASTNINKDATESAAKNATGDATENRTGDATGRSTESLTETIAEAGDQTKPAESETTALTETMATGKKKSIRKTIGWTIIVLAALTLTALAAFMILAHTAPDFIDSILYTPEELEIINR